jgi:MFS family permease
MRRVRAAWRTGPLADSNFRLLSAGQLTSTIGDMCYAVALPWLILSAHGGVIRLGIVLACYGVARALFAPVGGMLADKVGPRVVMLGADAGRCVVVAAFALLAARRLDTLALLGPVAAFVGAGEGLFLPASYSIIPTLLEEEKLQAGNALSEAMVQAGTLAGPVVGGILVAAAGPSPAFAVDAASFAISALSLALIGVRRSPAPAAAAQAAGAQATEAAPASPDTQQPAASGEPGRSQTLWSLLRTSRALQMMLLVGIVSNLAFGGTFDVALPTLAHAHFGATGYGALIACAAAGAVVGTLAAARGRAFARPMIVACGVVMVEAAAICLVPFMGGLPGTAAAILVFGAGNGFSNIVLLTLVQKWAPSQMLGRIMSLFALVSVGIFPASVAAAGFLVHQLGTTPFFPIAGILLAVTVLVALTQRELRGLGVSGQAPANPSGEFEVISADLGL